jgi:hypothetical protein
MEQFERKIDPYIYHYINLYVSQDGRDILEIMYLN